MQAKVVSWSGAVSVLCCGFVRHVAPDVLALSFKLKAETLGRGEVEKNDALF